jgi:hypothetical protein
MTLVLRRVGFSVIDRSGAIKELKPLFAIDCDFCHDGHGPTQPKATEKEAREDAKGDGWRRINKLKDMCIDCVEFHKATGSFGEVVREHRLI